jgi:ketosteroid isomerase-like protein
MTDRLPGDEEAAVLLANASFYQAFSDGDFAAMSALWAKRAAITCLHPGARGLFGRAPVLSSWEQILAGTRVPMRCDRPVVRVVGTAALVTCYEANGDAPAHLAATNVFALEEGTWRMIHHQAGPLMSPVPPPSAPTSVN